MTLKDKKEKLFADCIKYEKEGDEEKAMFCRWLIFSLSPQALDEYEEFRRAFFINQESK